MRQPQALPRHPAHQPQMGENGGKWERNQKIPPSQPKCPKMSENVRENQKIPDPPKANPLISPTQST